MLPAYNALESEDAMSRFNKAARSFRNMNVYPLSPTPDNLDFEDSLAKVDLPPPSVFGLYVKEEDMSDMSSYPTPYFPPDQEDLESSLSSESESGMLFDSVVEDVKAEYPYLQSLMDVLTGSEIFTGFSQVKFKYQSFAVLIQKLLPMLKDPVNDNNLTQAQRNHLKKIMKDVQNELETNLISGVLDQRICEWKIHFTLKCPLPMDSVYRNNIEESRIYFFKDCAKTYICPRTGIKRPYALEMDVCVMNEDGVPLNRDVDVQISLFRVFEGGRREEVPEFKTEEGGKRKRCWAMIMGDVRKSRISVKNKDNDKTKSTAIQTLYNGKGTLYGRVEIPSQPGPHQWVISPANLDEDIGKAIGKDFVVKSKRTARKRHSKRKRDEDHVNQGITVL